VRAENIELLERCARFETELGLAIAERVDRYAWGLAAFDDQLPLVWDANYIVVEWPGMSAKEIDAVAEEIFSAAGLAHREVWVDDPLEGERLARDMGRLGYDVQRDVYMIRRGLPDRPAETDAREAGWDEVAELRRRILGGTPEFESHEEVEQLLEWDKRQAEGGGDRWFIADLDGEPASCCRLLQRDGIGQVENVNTLGDARRHGLARSAVLAATEASLADSDELTFICAIAHDWPRLMYEKLGYDPIGQLAGFRRPPPRR